MLEQVWLWYVAPGVIGLVGLTLSEPDPGPGRFLYAAGVVVFGVVLAWINRRAAKRVFHEHARTLQRQIDNLDGAGPG